MSDDERTPILMPFIPKLLNTRGSKNLEQRRATMAADWLVRVHTPAWRRLAKLNEQAALLETLPEITDFAQCPSLMPTLIAVKQDAAAARAAACDAAGAALNKTRLDLQASAVQLIERMIAVTDDDLKNAA